MDMNVSSTRQRSGGGVKAGLGGSVILVAFAVLCLAIFGTLAFTTAFSDMRLTQRTAETVKDFYAADVAAQEAIALVDGQIKVMLADAETLSGQSAQTAFDKALASSADELEGLIGLEAAIKQEDGVTRISFEAKSPDNQKIMVTMAVGYEDAVAGKRYTLERYASSLSELPDYEGQMLDLWSGEQLP